MGRRIKTTITKNADGSENVTVTCKMCGEPITQTNEFGMYCKNLCGMDKDKEAKKQIDGILNNILGGFGGLK